MKIGKSFFITFLLFCKCSFAQESVIVETGPGNRKPVEIGSNIEIDLRIKNCIDFYKKDTVTFIIHNANNEGFWIDSWNLMLDSITNKNGRVVSSRSLVDYRHPALPEFTWVDANS